MADTLPLSSLSPHISLSTRPALRLTLPSLSLSFLFFFCLSTFLPPSVHPSISFFYLLVSTHRTVLGDWILSHSLWLVPLHLFLFLHLFRLSPYLFSSSRLKRRYLSLSVSLKMFYFYFICNILKEPDNDTLSSPLASNTHGKFTPLHRCETHGSCVNSNDVVNQKFA